MAERNKIALWLLGYSALPTSLWALDPPYPMPFVWSWVVSLKVGFNWQSTQFWRETLQIPRHSPLSEFSLPGSHISSPSSSQGCWVPPLYMATWLILAGSPHFFPIARRSLFVSGWCLCVSSKLFYLFLFKVAIVSRSLQAWPFHYSFCFFTLGLVTKPQYSMFRLKLHTTLLCGTQYPKTFF